VALGGAGRQVGYAFETGFENGSPVDLDMLLLGDQVSRQLSPAALRNNSYAGRFFEGVMPSPIRELARPQVALGAQEPRPVSSETIPAIDSPVGASGGIAVQGVGG
jgi:hypothetical protein